jgi:gamma-glutamyltranspeptidase/glutathione hydrolase
LPHDADHTVNVVTADREGNVVSMTSTQGEMLGSGVVIGGFGLIVGHGMSRFTYEHGHPNAPAPGKRMHHNMSPMIATDAKGNPRIAIGMVGGVRIPNISAQIAINMIDFGKRPADAIKHPRLQTVGGEPIVVSPAVPTNVVAELEQMGHKIEKMEAMGGPANAVLIEESGEITAANEMGKKGMVVI